MHLALISYYIPTKISMLIDGVYENFHLIFEYTLNISRVNNEYIILYRFLMAYTSTFIIDI